MDLLSYFNQEELEDFKKLSSTEAKRLFLQKKIKENFDALVYILGYRDLGEFHKEELKKIAQVRYLDEKSVRRLWLWSRGFFKTSLISIAHKIYLIINNPSIRILTVSNTLEISKKVLKEIRDHFVENEDFRFFFKEFCPIPNKDGKIEFGTTEQFTIPNRGKVLKEPTLMCAGIGTNLTGLHFDYMGIDDLVTRDSVSNDAQIQASKDYYASLRQLFDNPTCPREDIVGTTYHFNDLYADLKESTEFEKSLIPAIVNDKEVFPERFTKEGLQKILEDPTIGPWAFNSQYLLNPVNPKDAKFREEWLTSYDTLPSDLAEYILVDPASTQKKKSDYTVIEKWGLDYDGNAYLLNGIRDRLTVFQRINKIIEFAKSSKRLVEIKYEVLGGRHGDLEMLKERLMKEKLPFIVKETKATTSSKKDRIEQRLVGQFFSLKIRLPKMLIYRSEYDGKTKDFIQEFKLEFLQFPFTEHDDILDCTSQLFEEPLNLVKGKVPKSIVKDRPMTYDDLEGYYDEIDFLQRINPFLSRNAAINRARVRKIRLAMINSRI